MKLLTDEVLKYFQMHIRGLNKAIGMSSSPNDRIKLSMTRTETQQLVDNLEFLLDAVNIEETAGFGIMTDIQKKIATDWANECANALPFTGPDFPEGEFTAGATTTQVPAGECIACGGSNTEPCIVDDRLLRKWEDIK